MTVKRMSALIRMSESDVDRDRSSIYRNGIGIEMRDSKNAVEESI